MTQAGSPGALLVHDKGRPSCPPVLAGRLSTCQNLASYFKFSTSPHIPPAMVTYIIGCCGRVLVECRGSSELQYRKQRW
jgi:hypothetical protein